jgi:hypothetical protein
MEKKPQQEYHIRVPITGTRIFRVKAPSPGVAVQSLLNGVYVDQRDCVLEDLDYNKWDVRKA